VPAFYTDCSMDIAALNENFGLPGVLAFEESDGLTRAVVTSPVASATIYLQGAHLTHWQPVGEQPVLFLSGKSGFKAGKAIRGGVPIIFPWFGDRHDGQAGPAHGFARTAEWECVFAAHSGEDVHLTFTLSPNDTTRELGFDRFRVAYQLAIGRRLEMRLTVANGADMPLVFEEALHTYFAVADVRKVSTSGLQKITYLDKRDLDAEGNAKHKTQTEEPLVLTQATDRVYVDSASACVIDDPAGGRRITVDKSNSNTTIVWNPWEELTAKLADMEPDGWQGMLCVETANAGQNAVTLASGKIHTMRASVAVERVS
jgi:glucose-6-phosphate 1-epimerase